MEQETCDWCGLQFELTGVNPYLVGDLEVCLVCMLTVFALESQAAQEDSPPQT